MQAFACFKSHNSLYHFTCLPIQSVMIKAMDLQSAVGPECNTSCISHQCAILNS
jgi:hypothetical protein